MAELAIPQWVIRRVFGAVYCFLWFFSVVAGFFLFICPAIPLAFYCPKAYRKWSDTFLGMWESYSVVLMDVLFGVKVVMSGDWIDPSEGSIILMNHRTRLDWNFLWAAFYHGAHPHNHSLKFILKSEVMGIPGPGWAMQACSYLFIKRQWNKDKQLLSNLLKYLQITEKPCQIVIFPEGTDLTAKSVNKSNEFADKSKLQHYSKVLHPRTTGFLHLVKEMRKNGQMQAIYDFSVGYPTNLASTELDLLKGDFPSEIHFHVTRYDDSELPKDETELKQWLEKRWQEKEAALNEFYEHGSFNPQGSEENSLSGLLSAQQSENEVTATSQRMENQDEAADAGGQDNHPRSTRRCQKMKHYSTGHLLYLSLTFWTFLVALFFYMTLFVKYFQMWIGFNAFVFLLLTIVGDGFQQILARYSIRYLN